jgi:uncharacterized protein
MSEQVVIDSLDFARTHSELHGKIAASDLPRIQDLLSSGKGLIEYNLFGDVNGMGKPVLRLEVKGQIPLQCQRCLGSMLYDVDFISRLELVRGLNELPEDDSGEEDDFDQIEADPKLDVLALVEDEILLGLPIAPRHPEGACEMDGKPDENPESGNPFGVLANLKRKS